MPVINFPDPNDADPDGLLAVGGDLHPQSLLLAYRSGIFPWPVEMPDRRSGKTESVLAWFSPDPRAILDFSELHVPESLSRARRRSGFLYTIDRAFDQVIDACASVPRPGQRGTWITDEMKSAYLELHRLGYAHSAEAWEGQELVGGIYGVSIDGAFAGESMFHRRPNASKLALLHLVEHLKAGGLGWMDIQMMTPHMKALGAREISRDDFLRKLSRTRALGLRPFDRRPGNPRDPSTAPSA